MSYGNIIEISKQLMQIPIIRKLFILILVALIQPQFVNSCLEEEKIGLLHLKSYLESYDHFNHVDRYAFEMRWSRFHNGDQGHYCCALEWVQCNPSTGRVISLDLTSMVNRDDKIQKNTKLWLFNVTLFRPFTQLIHLYLAGNGINGLIEHDGSVRISTLKNLQTLDLDMNPLRTNYVSLGALTLLRSLSLSECELNHSMAELGICELRDLQELSLYDAHIFGGVPSCLSNLTSLKFFDLGGNQLNGKFPVWLTNLTLLEFMDLSYNSFEGQLCLSSLANLSMLQTLVLSSSGLQIQTEDSSWIPTFQLRGLFLADCYLNAPHGGDNLVMSALDLSCNNLSGVIPSEWGDLRHIKSINLSHNNLYGSIPIGFSNLELVESLDLSYNQLTGIIPSQLIQLHSLAVFNVSFNNLSGKTPETGQFGTFDESSYRGNPKLCVSLVNKSCHQTYVRPSPTIKQVKNGEETSLMEDFWWCFGVTSSIAFLATIAILAINPYWRKAWFDFVEYHLLWWRF